MSDPLETSPRENAELATALRELARDLRTPAPGPGLVDEVLGRVAAPGPAGSRRRARWLAPVVAVLLATGLGVSPVGAKVAEWLDFAGVMVRESDSGQESGPPGTPTVPAEPTATAATGATFRPLVPTALGEPDGLSVGADGRLVSMSWTQRGRTIRIDQFDAGLDPMFWKSAPDAVLVRVAGSDALWFPSPHEVVVTPEGDGPEAYPPRLAAHTLVVPLGGLTVRLEGDLTLRRAVRIAGSLE
ncbi:hypothetical protein [Nocardioides ferulae]|uniref:hypothetical protein n=1 Tax=Nocardioides ferulae TaxID=2340821 RepID=UPI000EAF90B2|nr:hypothetical protein [Nocardioides ferulae]